MLRISPRRVRAAPVKVRNALFGAALKQVWGAMPLDTGSRPWVIRQDVRPSGIAPSWLAKRRGAVPSGTAPYACWISTLPDAKNHPDERSPELRRWTVNGFYVDWIADELAEAARLPGDWRGRWDGLAQWLREDLDPEAIRRAIERVAARPGYTPPRSIALFDAAVREDAARKAA